MWGLKLLPRPLAGDFFLKAHQLRWKLRSSADFRLWGNLEWKLQFLTKRGENENLARMPPFENRVGRKPSSAPLDRDPPPPQLRSYDCVHSAVSLVDTRSGYCSGRATLVNSEMSLRISVAISVLDNKTPPLIRAILRFFGYLSGP